MPKSLVELQNKRLELAEKIRELGGKFDQEKAEFADPTIKANWDQLNKDYDGVMAEMDAIRNSDAVLKRLAQIQSAIDSPGTTHVPDPPAEPNLPGMDNFSSFFGYYGRRPTANRGPTSEETKCRALAAWMKGQLGRHLSERDWEASHSCGIHPFQNHLDFGFPEGIDANLRRLYRAFGNMHPQMRDLSKFDDFKLFNAPLTTTTGSSGGNLIIPETLLRRLEINMLAFGGMREVSEIMTTASGEDLSWPTANDTANKGRIVAESTAVDDNAGGGTSGDGGPNPTFGKVTWGAFKYTSDTILVPFELLEDSVIDLPSVLGDMLGERLGRITNLHYTTGTGTTLPNGIVPKATAYVHPGALADGITTAVVYRLQHAVDPAYRNGAQFMCNDATVLLLRLLVDDMGRPIWQSGFQEGVPDMVAGARIVVNQDMASVAANAKVLLYGQLNRYKIRRVNGLRMYRLQELYRAKDQDGFVAFIREDGNLLTAGTAPVKVLQMPAA